MSDEAADVWHDLDPRSDPAFIRALEKWNRRQEAWRPFKKYRELDLDERIEVEGLVSR